MIEVKDGQVKMEGHWDEIMYEWAAVTKGLYEMTAKQIGTGKTNEMFVSLFVKISADVGEKIKEDGNE